MLLINKLFHSKVSFRNRTKIKYIVIHYTANTTSKAGTAYNTACYFRDSSEGSADYIVDDSTVYLCNSNIDKYYSWAVGGSKYTSMTTNEGGKYYGKCTNKNSISVEICSNKKDKSNLNGSAKDWYFTESALSLAAELTKELMDRFNIPIENVIMHHHVTGKVCPNPFCVTQGHLNEWKKFKNRLITKVEESKKEEDEMIDTILIKVNGKDIKINRILKDGRNFIELRGLENAGFNVDYDAKSKLVSLNSSINELPLIVDGKRTSVEAVNIEAHNFCPIRSISSAVDNFDVDFIDNTVNIKTK